MSAESVVLDALAKHRIYTGACRGCSWRIPQDYLASAHLTNEACDEHRAAEVAKALATRAAAPVEAGGDNARSLLRNKVRFWRGEQKNGPVWALVLRELQSILDSTPDELVVPKWVLDQSREQILRLQATVQEYQQETTDAAAPVEAGLAERVAERAAFHEAEGKRYRERMDLVKRQPSRGGKNPERADAYDLGLNEGRALISELAARDLAALLRPTPAADGGAES